VSPKFHACSAILQEIAEKSKSQEKKSKSRKRKEGARKWSAVSLCWADEAVGYWKDGRVKLGDCVDEKSCRKMS
jgi:hypothetical protein